MIHELEFLVFSQQAAANRAREKAAKKKQICTANKSRRLEILTGVST